MATSSTPEVEKIDLSKVHDVEFEDDAPSTSGYGTATLPPTTLSSRFLSGRPEDAPTELQDIMSLQAVLGTTLFTNSQYNKSMEETAKILMDDMNYEEAATLLESVKPIGCRQQLMLAECYLQIGQEKDAKITIGKAARLMTSSLRLRVHDVIGGIRKAVAKRNYVKALILLQCSPRYAFLKMVPNEAVVFIERRLSDYNRVVRAMVKIGGRVGEIAEFFVKEQMLDIMVLFREISRAQFHKKMTCEARILTYFGLCYREIGEHTKSLECFQQGIEIMSLSFDDRVTKTKLFGTLLQNAGLQFETLGELDMAESHYISALDAFTDAYDWEDARDERKCIFTTTSNLEIVQKKLHNLTIEADKMVQEILDKTESTDAKSIQTEGGVDDVTLLKTVDVTFTTFGD